MPRGATARHPPGCVLVGMRAVWKGAVTFGLVNVPVKLYSATEDHDVSLHQVHDDDGGRIRYQRVCEIDGKLVDYKNIDKAYDDGERTVVITDADLKSLPAERSREIEVVEFVPTEQIDPIMFDRSYYLDPTPRRTRPTCCCAARSSRPTRRRSCAWRCGRRRGSRRCGCTATCSWCRRCSGATRCARRSSRRSTSP